ncbi:hypothetical protein CJ179_38495 [Rhodococcus sp. ACS1]|uniref:hypothetical protein n=1 Tax=Rhodococcus sp. ACS1 TaxID=2028570 RepID=UPI000BB14BA6|nr:hypothetical protein [Rhodococcus sp. ACS1]PBC38491.1 hypothetical protein CJ179_38495 [Rhodococcus sp. ACS1]
MATLTSKERKKLNNLKRRRTHLQDRITDHATNPNWRGSSWDEAEFAALDWAIDFIEKAEDAEEAVELTCAA